MSETPARAAVPTGPADGVRWHHSLYWRIAFGFVAFLAVLLLVQSLIFVWMLRQTGGLFPATSNDRLADLIAADLRDTLEADPTTDIGAHLASDYARVVQPFVVVLADGRAYANRDVVPPALLRSASAVMARLALGRPLPRQRRGGGREGPFFFSPIILNAGIAGLVVVPPGPPPLLGALRELGPMLAGSAVLLLAVGAGAAALLIFGPARRRLREVESAALRIGAGDVRARAPVSGADEVTALARSFNRMAADLQERAEALAASDRARRQLLADVSHELMTPLTAARGYLETLGMPELQLDAATRERYIRIIEDETHRLERIVGDLLDLARLEGGGAGLRRERVSIDGLFARVAARHERVLAERRLALTRDIAPDAREVPGDPDRLEQVLQNLAANAIRHTPDGGRLALGASRHGASIHLTVHDSGPGIAPEHLPLIFDRFYKADAARATGGSGLGLSIVQAIVDAHGGTVSASNEDGARFEIVLPAEIPQPR